MNSGQKKGINFDLDTNALKIYYTEGDWRNAYHDVRNFLRKWPDEKGSADIYIGSYEGRSAEAGSFGSLLY